jgi:DNA-binding Lrp family transcriptional regulator
MLCEHTARRQSRIPERLELGVHVIPPAEADKVVEVSHRRRTIAQLLRSVVSNPLKCNEMDRHKSAREVAAELGTSVPRVIRAIDRLGLDVETTPGGWMRLSSRDVRRLERELGVTPSIDGLSRTDCKVLAALAAAPLGLPSQRAIAARAVVSPTAAGRAVGRLVDRGLVERRRVPVAMGGVREVEMIRVDVTAADWPAIARELGHARPTVDRRGGGQRRVPARLRHLFWNTAPEQLDVRAHGGYIARRLLTAGDLEGLAWGDANLSSADWEHAAQARGIGADRRSLARNLASASR